MIFAAALLAFAQVVVPAAAGLTLDQRIEVLAGEKAGSVLDLESVIFEDPQMRAEIRRVGFVAGCAAVGEASRSVAARHTEILRPYAVEAVRSVVPAQRIEESRILSFLAAGLGIYSSRVDAAIERLAVEPLTAARSDMRTAFRNRLSGAETTRDPNANVVVPRTDIARALGIAGPWNLDNPNHARMACAEQRISPEQRPTISGGGPAR